MTNHVTIVGAGPAGSMLSILLARQGLSVSMYESRPDMRTTDIGAGRSINLALATRGIEALAEVGVMSEVERILIPMMGRLIHDETGRTSMQPYGSRPHEYINSVSRTALTSILLDAAEATGQVDIHFDMRCRGVDFDGGTLRFIDSTSGDESRVPFTTIFGTDGSASPVREALLEVNGGNVDIEPLTHGYKELTMPADSKGGFQIEKEALHIWPRRDFMLIALPDLVGTFTVTLFLANEGPIDSFEHLTSDGEVLGFFEKHFADFAPLVPDLANQFTDHPHGRLATVRTTGWAHADRAVVLGDASHGVVPFHGQGMNAAFESCIVLDGCMRNNPNDWATAFAKFEQDRKPDTDAIADMAVANYVEMSSSVVDEHYQLKRAVALELDHLWPEQFTPRYAMVMFNTIPYAEVQRRAILQGEVLDRLTEGLTDIDEVDWVTAEEMVVGLDFNQVSKKGA
ncbi:MAG: NAD(P)/FAD-dependent oxidoreductase [Acidimicrobiales bacterium]|nr:NAD(P)/FAD-dependent oxidoreductase [Acidimicrobiales bacterium]MDP7258721.1 NAD(P)/FAD-dependent oxidoreductase [Acidimicrobiales bacterium]HCV35454.1 FAD-dependent monooxygenase [Acidimicrobiaceae bacterium]HJO79295.1 NAD(P)/FAD-dependent oxidoreductase [Acidimicrobiales bacterium]